MARNINASIVVSMPIQLFTLSRKFQAASNGKIYIGQIDKDPTIPENQIQVYLEGEDGNVIPVSQPLIINQAGIPVYNGQTAKFVTTSNHSMAVYDSYGAQQFYFSDVFKRDPYKESVEIIERSISGVARIYPRSVGESLDIGAVIPDLVDGLPVGYVNINGVIYQTSKHVSGIVSSIDDYTISVGNDVVTIDSSLDGRLSKSNLAEWSASKPTTDAFRSFIKHHLTLGHQINIDTKVCIDNYIEAINDYSIDIKCTGQGRIYVDFSFKSGIALWVSSLPYPNGGDRSVYWDSSKRSGGVRLLSNAKKYDIKIDVMGLSLSPGDMIKISSSEEFVPTRGQYTKGEIAEVESVNGTKVRLTQYLSDSYDSTKTMIFKITMPVAVLDNLKIIRPDDENYQTGIEIWECQNIDINRPDSRYFKDRCLEVAYCVDGEVRNQKTRFAARTYDTDSRTSYSCNVASCTNIVFSGGSAMGGRHSFATGGWEPNRNIKVYNMRIGVDDKLGNGVAALDSHENIDGLTINKCDIKGGVNIAGQNIDFSKNGLDINTQLRGVEIRVAKSCDYIRAKDNNSLGGDSIGGIVVRPMSPDITVRLIEQDDNVVVMETQFNRVGVGIEPTQSATGFKVEMLKQTGNQVSLRKIGTNGGSCFSTYDLTNVDNIPSITHHVFKDNYGFNSNGRVVEFRNSSPDGLLVTGSNELVNQGDSSTFRVHGYKTVVWNDSRARASQLALDNNRANIFENIVTLTINDSIFQNSYYNGYRLVNVTTHNPVNVERINCKINNADFSRVNAKFTPHSWAVVGGDGTNHDTYNCTVEKTGSGRYTIRFNERQSSNNAYPVIATPTPQSITRNNYNECVLIFGSDMSFSFVSY
ncbi:phage head-binding domain-containing protein [Providencia vermicola]|uniref:phage head-binding domain-containing protein n=1 Tax=Providencia vermicola TaxID=333965 RepID=UPI0032DA056B